MRCEDCLPLVEEYFDGEVEETTALRMGAHFSACPDCAAALDALSFEQEIYARYDRGLEAGPDLWARVSAEIAREPLPAALTEARRPFLSRLGEQLAAGLAALTARPALSSSLALLVVGVVAGSLWLSSRQQPQTTPATDVVQNVAAPRPSATVENVGVAPQENESKGSLNDDPAAPNVFTAAATRGGSRAGAAQAATPQAAAAAAEVSLETLLDSGREPQANPNIVVIRADDHATPDGMAALFDPASVPSGGDAALAARMLEPGEKEVARHVEQTQMLLRSIKNARAPEAGAADVAYEKDLSRKLLARNATLQLEAEVKGDKETKQVLDAIEPFLLDIANLRENPSRDEVRSIRERVRKNDIVAALEVY